MQLKAQIGAGAKASESGMPDSEALAMINSMALTPLEAREIYTRTVYLAHNAIDRDDEVFDDALLDDFATTLPGKGLFVRHPGGWDGDSGPGEGRFYAARVVDMSLDEARELLREPGLRFAPGTERAKLLEASFYAVRTDENATLLRKIDAGVAGDVSIGFRAAERTNIHGADGAAVARRLHAPGEALEGSLVWLGAQPGARIHKAAHGAGSDAERSRDVHLSNPLQNPAICGGPIISETPWETGKVEQGSSVDAKRSRDGDLSNPLSNPAICDG
jgi:hypothetical protein